MCNQIICGNYTKLHLGIKSADKTVVLQRGINRVSEWTETWMTKLYKEKCKQISVTKNAESTCVYIVPTIGGTALIEQKDSEKGLGIYY